MPNSAPYDSTPSPAERSKERELPTPIGELIDLVREQEDKRRQHRRGERALLSDAEAAELEYKALRTEREELRELLLQAYGQFEHRGWRDRVKAVLRKP